MLCKNGVTEIGLTHWGMEHLKDSSTLESGQENLEFVGITEVKKHKDKPTRINMCWQIGDEKKCVTLPRDHAYETRDWVEEQGGVVFWSQVLPD
jgi:hypothetical protein